MQRFFRWWRDLFRRRLLDLQAVRLLPKKSGCANVNCDELHMMNCNS
jgi:hypothetical protein